MSEAEAWTGKDVFGSSGFALFLAGLGACVFMSPGGAEEMSGSGRGGLWKLLITYVWSGGVMLINRRRPGSRRDHPSRHRAGALVNM